MISAFSSYIELFAAIYLTISLDDLLLKRFWTPDYESKMSKALKSIKMPGVALSSILQQTKSLSRIEEARSRKRGVLMFGLTVWLLILSGFEEKLLMVGQNGEAIILIALSILTLIAFGFDDRFLKTGWSVIIVTLLIPFIVSLIFLSSRRCEFICMFYSRADIVLVFSAQLLLLFSLLLPVVWQLFRNWLYTRSYIQYIVDETSMRAKEYRYALSYQKGTHQMTKVAKPYMNIVADSLGDNWQDLQITSLINTLKSELSKIVFVPRMLVLLRCLHERKRKYHPGKHRLNRLVKEYENQNTKNRIDQFCQEHNIDTAAFKAYRSRSKRR